MVLFECKRNDYNYLCVLGICLLIIFFSKNYFSPLALFLPVLNYQLLHFPHTFSFLFDSHDEYIKNIRPSIFVYQMRNQLQIWCEYRVFSISYESSNEKTMMFININVKIVLSYKTKTSSVMVLKHFL